MTWDDDIKKEKLKIIVPIIVMILMFVCFNVIMIKRAEQQQTVEQIYEGYLTSIDVDNRDLTVLLNETTYVSMRLEGRYTKGISFDNEG